MTTPTDTPKTDLQQSPRDNEIEKQTQSTRDSKSPTPISSPKRKKSSKTKPTKNRAQVPAQSAAKLAANRRNAKNSTGPRTKRGKATVARNARKFTRFSKLLAVHHQESSEDIAELNKLVAELVAEHQPQSRTERELVEGTAACLWRRQRAFRFEAMVMQHQLDLKKAEANALERDREEIESDLEQYKSDYDRTEADLVSLRSEPPDGDDAALKAYEVTVRRVAEQIGAQGETPSNLIARLEDLKTMCAGRMLALRDRNNDLIERRRALWAGQASVCLPPRDELIILVRYENMINRQLHRALAELRRLRESSPPRDPSPASPEIEP